MVAQQADLRGVPVDDAIVTSCSIVSAWEFWYRSGWPYSKDEPMRRRAEWHACLGCL